MVQCDPNQRNNITRIGAAEMSSSALENGKQLFLTSGSMHALQKIQELSYGSERISWIRVHPLLSTGSKASLQRVPDTFPSTRHYKFTILLLRARNSSGKDILKRRALPESLTRTLERISWYVFWLGRKNACTVKVSPVGIVFP